MYKRYQSIHFVGIGGAGMSGIAEVLHTLGYKVTGSDMKASANTSRLSEMGIRIDIGHRAGNIKDAQVLVISSAVSPGNPEVKEALLQGVPVIPRAEMLAEIGRLKYSVLVAGSHGKTTTTSLVATAVARAGLDPTVVIGGRLNALGANARHGKGEFLVAEADESDGSFLKLSPTIAIVTNIDREHMEYFKTMHALEGAFLEFLNKVPFYGLNVVCVEDSHLAGMIPDLKRRVLKYGFGESADLRAVEIEKGFMSVGYTVLLRGRELFRLNLPLPGDHNVLNSLAAIGAALELDIEPMAVKQALEGFQGIGRRLELKGEAKGIRVYDDYGHHPTEIKATIKSLRDGFPSGGAARIFVLFQPHRYTRTRDLMEEFATSFGATDRLLLMDIYAAGEQPIEGIDSGALFKRLSKHIDGRATYVKDRDEAMNTLEKELRQGDVLLTLGAGDVWKISEQMVERLSK
ncbi:MAG: UDP-N-acetylmuramate--L-alanine ligase [Actinomycetota bacterium]|nr:UDP-N-acetylmuramate--L-alanine ligase [Actinomycetota bacterium]